jgi:hypothetical protein
VATASSCSSDCTGMASNEETSCNRLGEWGVANLGRGSRVHISAVCPSDTNHNTAVEYSWWTPCIRRCSMYWNVGTAASGHELPGMTAITFFPFICSSRL